MFYDLDISLHIKRFLATVNNKPKTLSLAESYLQPVTQLHEEFIEYRKNKLIQLSYNNQKILLEKALNDVYDPTNRGIFIENLKSNILPTNLFHDSENEDETYIFHDNENQQHFHLYHDQELIDELNFIINVPISLSNFHDAIIKFTEGYNYITMKYGIRYY